MARLSLRPERRNDGKHRMKALLRRLSPKPPAETFRWPAEATERERSLMQTFSAYTMTSPARQWSLLKAVQYIDAHEIPGDIVECGVWRGGNMLMVKQARAGHPLGRKLHLFDTFAGMSEPTGEDVSFRGKRAAEEFRASQKSDHNEWCYASLEDVRAAFEQFGLLAPDVVFRKGKVEETLLDRAALPGAIALLRLDTDWYESTKAELDVLYPLLVPGGVLIVDDYGHWQGARKAVDEYFGNRMPLLLPVDYSCRIAVKPA